MNREINLVPTSRAARELRRVATCAACTGLLLGVLTGCASSSATSHARVTTGVITGQAPICYGPGPDTNLDPRATIRATPTDGGAPVTVVVRTSAAHHSYRLTLPAGAYTISAYSGSISAVVHARTTLNGVDLPQPGCL